MRGTRQKINWKSRTRGRRRENVDILTRRMTANIGLLNIDGCSTKGMVDVENAMSQKEIDGMCLVETHLRKEDRKKIEMDGCEVFETRREEVNEEGVKDKRGGGIAFLAKKREGILWTRYLPRIKNVDHAYVDKERLWVTYESKGGKTAVCCVYMGCEAKRHEVWNEGIFEVLSEEVFNLRAKGFRILLKGDFNGWVGNVLAEGGIPGNRAEVNNNGRRFKRFLEENNLFHLNGACRVVGDWSTRLSSGVWTRHSPDYSSSTVLDFSVGSVEHFESFLSLEVDEGGRLGGDSDHNILITKIRDKFLAVEVVPKIKKKPGFDIKEDQDWTRYRSVVKHKAEEMMKKDDGTTASLSSILGGLILNGLEEGVGRKPPHMKPKSMKLPKEIVEATKERRKLETVWKTQKTLFAADRSQKPPESLVVAAQNLEEANRKVEEMLQTYKKLKRAPIKEICKMKTKKGRQMFWNHVSRKRKISTEISALQNKRTGALLCKSTEIAEEVYVYLSDIFSGKDEHQEVIPEGVLGGEGLGGEAAQEGAGQEVGQEVPGGAERGEDTEGAGPGQEGTGDHGYGANPQPKLRSLDNSNEPDTDPGGYLDKDFSEEELKEVLAGLGNGKAAGWDTIPNEALKEAPPCLLEKMLVLFNRVKNGGGVPEDWKKGRLVLIHKKG